MEHVIIREFSISRDWKSIAWGATLWHNALRSACAGLVWCVLILALGGAKGPDSGTVLAMPIIFPIAYLIVYLPIGLVCAFLTRFIPFIGLITFIIALFFALPGDPIVWFLSLVAPRVVPMHKPGFLNFALIMWVLKAEDAVEVTITNTTAVNKL